MSYNDRLRQMKYIAPSGSEFILLFDSLSRTGGKKAPVSEFPGQNQGAVQDLGNVTPTFPVECYITGQDYDTEADRLWEALHESGPGTLEHPRWGNISVLPIPNTQTEQFVDGAGRAVFDITFIRADETQFDYPVSSIDYPTQVSAAVDSFDEGLTDSVPAEITDVKEKASLKELYLNAIGKATDFFNNIADIADDIKEEFYQIIRDIENQIDELVLEPSKLLRAMLRVYRILGQAVDTVNSVSELSIKEKIGFYVDVYETIIDGFKETSERYSEDFNLTNIAHLQCLAVSNAEAAVYGKITTRNQAGEIVESVDSFYKTVRSDIEEIDNTVGYSLSLRTEIAVSQTLNGLIDQSLNLPAERVLVLDREIPAIALVHELYGNIDNLDDFMEYNNLCCDEILLIPRGREVRYYFE